MSIWAWVLCVTVLLALLLGWLFLVSIKKQGSIDVGKLLHIGSQSKAEVENAEADTVAALRRENERLNRLLISSDKEYQEDIVQLRKETKDAVASYIANPDMLDRKLDQLLQDSSSITKSEN